jgi:carbonic anhydrase
MANRMKFPFPDRHASPRYSPLPPSMPASNCIIRTACGLAAVIAAWSAVPAAPATAGTMQSPIDIVTADVVHYPGGQPLTFHYPTSANLTLTDINAANTEGTVRAVVNTLSWLDFSSDTYNLLQFHFHAPAEHAIDGHLAAMEMHFVNQSTLTGGYLVVSRFLELGASDNALLEPIFSSMSSIPNSGDTVTLTEFNINALLPVDESVYRYDGSLTTSPYAEGVLWNIFTAPPLLVSQAQLDEFTALFPNGDARELQPLDGRAVYLVPEPSSWAIAIGLGLASWTASVFGVALRLALRGFFVGVAG